MVTKSDYTLEGIRAARSVMLELHRLLGEYAQYIIVIGGWVPELLIPQNTEPHVGSMDVDLAINHREIPEEGYKSILELLVSHGYERGEQPFIFHRTVEIEGKEVTVQVDFLAGEYAGTGKSHRTQKAQGIRPRKARGADLAFENPVILTLEDVLSGGGKDNARIQVTSIPTFLIMKGFALGARLKEKDAYDISYCLRNSKGGIDKIINDMGLLAGNKLANESFKIIAEKYADPETVGPVHAVNFQELSDEDEIELEKRDAFERVQALLKGIQDGEKNIAE